MTTGGMTRRGLTGAPGAGAITETQAPSTIDVRWHEPDAG